MYESRPWLIRCSGQQAFRGWYSSIVNAVGLLLGDILFPRIITISLEGGTPCV